MKGKHDIPIMVVGFRLESINAIRASNYFSLACREWKASFLSLTLNGRIRIKSASAQFLPPITTAEGWEDGQIPVVAMDLIIPWQDPVAIDGSAYNRWL